MNTKICKQCRKEQDMSNFSLCYVTIKGKEIWSTKCKECMKQYSKNYFSNIEGIYTAKKHEAKRRKKEFNLTLEQFENIYKQKNCYYCGQTAEEAYNLLYHLALFAPYFQHAFRKSKKMLIFVFERYDNNKGYNVNNVVRACRICNNSKGRVIHGDDYKKIAKQNIEGLKKQFDYEKWQKNREINKEKLNKLRKKKKQKKEQEPMFVGYKYKLVIKDKS